MKNSASLREVVCYHCGTSVLVPGSARSGSCAQCHQRINLDDLVVETATTWPGPLFTCGRIVIRPRTRLSTRLIAAAEGIEVSGKVQSRLSCWGTVTLQEDAVFRGDCRASALVVRPGAVIEGGFFEIVPPHRAPRATAGAPVASTAQAGVLA